MNTIGNVAQGPPVKTQGRQRQYARILVEQPDHHLLAPHHRRYRNTQVNLFATRANLELPILWHPVLINPQVAQDLDARNQRWLNALGQRHRLLQDAVDTVANLQVLLAWLHMDVRRVGLRRVVENGVQRPRNRGVLDQVLQALRVLRLYRRVLVYLVHALCRR